MSTASTRNRLFYLPSHDYKLTPECSFRFWHASLQHRPPSVSSLWELKGKVTLSYYHGCELTSWWIESRHLAGRSSTTTKYLSMLTRLRPPSVSPNSLDYGLQVHSSNRARSRRPSASPNSLHYGLQVYLLICPITACKFARSWPPIAYPNSLDYGLQVAYLQSRSITASLCISKDAPLIAPSASPNLLDHNLGVHLQSHSVMASKCTFKYTRLPPRSASPKSLDHSLRVSLWVHSIDISRLSLISSQTPPAASLDIPCVDGSLYRYIDENTNWIHEF